MERLTETAPETSPDKSASERCALLLEGYKIILDRLATSPMQDEELAEFCREWSRIAPDRASLDAAAGGEA